jgi:hypothetical protein
VGRARSGTVRGDAARRCDNAELHALLDRGDAVEHTDRTAAGTWRYLKDTSATGPSWAVRIYATVPREYLLEDRVPPLPPASATSPRIAVSIAYSKQPPAHLYTRRQLEQQLAALQRAIRSWARKEDLVEDNLGFHAFEEYYDEHPLEYFQDLSNPCVSSGVGSDGIEFTDLGPCVLVLTADADCAVAIEHAASFDALVDATAFRYETYAYGELWFFAREPWLDDAFVAYFEATRPTHVDLMPASIDRILHPDSDDTSLIGRVFYAGTGRGITTNEFCVVIAEAGGDVAFLELPTTRTPARSQQGYEVPVLDEAKIRSAIEERRYFRAKRNSAEHGSFWARLNAYRPWDGTPRYFDTND